MRSSRTTFLSILSLASSISFACIISICTGTSKLLPLFSGPRAVVTAIPAAIIAVAIPMTGPYASTLLPLGPLTKFDSAMALYRGRKNGKREPEAERGPSPLGRIHAGIRHMLTTDTYRCSNDDGATATDKLREVANYCRVHLHQDGSTTGAIVLETLLGKHESGVTVLRSMAVVCEDISTIHQNDTKAPGARLLPFFLDSRNYQLRSRRRSSRSRLHHRLQDLRRRQRHSPWSSLVVRYQTSDHEHLSGSFLEPWQ
ncbi:hypothetical protein KCU78_g16, partial [Aureobasidium melanogenum]